MNLYKGYHLYLNGNYLGIINKKFKYRIGSLNSYISRKYYNYNPIILKDINNNIITDEYFEKMMYKGICYINAYYS